MTFSSTQAIWEECKECAPGDMPFNAAMDLAERLEKENTALRRAISAATSTFCKTGISDGNIAASMFEILINAEKQ